MVTKADKCHLLTMTSEEVSVKTDNEIIKNSLQGKPSEIVIDNRLTFEPHMKNLCKKAGRKRHALARIPNYMVISKKCSIINAISFHNSRIVRWYGGFTVENLIIE